jgi:hypothetical protein
MIRPVRLQLSRRPGFNLQAESRAINGLPAINCARPSLWGNPFIVGRHAATASECVDLYVNDLAGLWPRFYRSALETLPGHNLACWCDLYAPCHVDTLLDIFGRIECREAA